MTALASQASCSPGSTRLWEFSLNRRSPSRGGRPAGLGAVLSSLSPRAGPARSLHGARGAATSLLTGRSCAGRGAVSPRFLLPPRLPAERGSRPIGTPPPSLLPGLTRLSPVTGKFQSRRAGGREPCRARHGERGLPWAPLLPPSTPGALGGRAGSRAEPSQLCPVSCSATFFTLRSQPEAGRRPGAVHWTGALPAATTVAPSTRWLCAA